MLKWTLALCFFTTAAMAAPVELLYKLKAEKDHWGIRKLRVSDKAPLDVTIGRMLATGLYEFVAPNTRESTPLEDDQRTDVSNQWHHSKIQTLDAWGMVNLTNRVVVAVCDSGAQPDHEDLVGQLLPGRNLITDQDDSSITTSHGTFVAGVIAAKADAIGVAGVAPLVSILPLRISDERGSASMELILKCIRYAADAGAKVINVSFTGVNHPGVQEAGEYANRKGALLVYAAGNQGRFRSSTTYPDYKNVLAVGGTSSADTRWKWYIDSKNNGGSNYGVFIDIMAPAEDIYSTTTYAPEGNYRTGSGTSYATPMVSAVAALLFSINPRFTPAQVERFILQSADSMGSPSYYGAGRLNAFKAVERARANFNLVEAI